MKTKSLLVAATLFFGAVATTQAQINPTAPQTGGTLNQTTIPPATPSNPGTIDQRVPTTTNPTQMGTGTIDQRTTVPMGTNVPSQMGTGNPAVMQRPATVEQQTMQRGTTQPTTRPIRRSTTTKRTTETVVPRP